MDGTAGITVFDTSIGTCGVAWTKHGIDRVQLPEHDRARTVAGIRSFASDRDEFPSRSRRIPSSIREATRRLKHHLDGRLDDLADVRLDLRAATPFARVVYQRLRGTRPGVVLSYGDLARAAGRPNAARAVGRAMATNPVPLLVPCHRVLASDRSLHGFSAPGGASTKVRLLFIEGVVLDEAHGSGMEHVFAADPKLRRLARVHGPFSPISHYRDDAYDAMFEAIIFQQLSTKAARTIAGRVHALSRGDGYARPSALARISDEELRNAGLSHQKIGYLRSLAEHTARGALPFSKFRRMPDEEIVETLTAVRGFGRWSAEMFLMFHLGRLDVFPIGDLGVRKGMAKVYGIADDDRVEMERIADRWRPYRSIGSWYMWRALESE